MKAHHISLLTGDFQQNYDYYTGVIGLRFIKNSINQANSHMRHVYYGDFLGTPGTVVTFFPDSRLDRQRVDGQMFYSGIHFAIPTGTMDFWKERFIKNGFKAEVKDGVLHTLDPDEIPLEFAEHDDTQFDWHVNFFSDIPGEKQVLGITGTTLHVPDVKATADFYHNWLGLEIKDNQVIMDDGQAIRLYQTPSDAPKSKFGKGSIDHFALAVDRGSELRALWDKAAELGYHQELAVDRGYFNSIYVIEPGGNRVEIATNNPGFTLDESINDLGTTFAIPPRFEDSREQLLHYWSLQGVTFEDQEPYTGTGHPGNAPVRPEYGESGNTYNG